LLTPQLIVAGYGISGSPQFSILLPERPELPLARSLPRKRKDESPPASPLSRPSLPFGRPRRNRYRASRAAESLGGAWRYSKRRRYAGLAGAGLENARGGGK